TLKKVGAGLVESRTETKRTTYVVIKPPFLLDLKEEYGLGTIPDPTDPSDPYLRHNNENKQERGSGEQPPVSRIHPSDGSDGSAAKKLQTLDELRRKSRKAVL